MKSHSNEKAFALPLVDVPWPRAMSQQLSDDRTHRRSQLAQMLLERADLLHSSIAAAAEEEMAEWESQMGPASESSTQHPDETSQLHTRVHQRIAADSRQVASAEIRRLRANVAKAKQNLRAMQQGRNNNNTAGRTANQTGRAAGQRPSTQQRAGPAPVRAVPSASHPSQDPRLQAMLVELSRCEAEVASLRERELALVGVLASHRHRQR